MSEKEETETEKKISIEMAALRDIISGFNEQSIGIAPIHLRYLELEGEFTPEDAEEAVTLYKEVMETIMAGHNLTVTQLAAYYILSELVLQRKDAVLQSVQSVAKPGIDEEEDKIGYA